MDVDVDACCGACTPRWRGTRWPPRDSQRGQQKPVQPLQPALSSGRLMLRRWSSTASREQTSSRVPHVAAFPPNCTQNKLGLLTLISDRICHDLISTAPSTYVISVEIYDQVLMYRLSENGIEFYTCYFYQHPYIVPDYLNKISVAQERWDGRGM